MKKPLNITKIKQVIKQERDFGRGLCFGQLCKTDASGDFAVGCLLGALLLAAGVSVEQLSILPNNLGGTADNSEIQKYADTSFYRDERDKWLTVLAARRVLEEHYGITPEILTALFILNDGVDNDTNIRRAFNVLAALDFFERVTKALHVSVV